MYRLNNAETSVASAYEQKMTRRDLTNLRHNMHDMCTRSNTNFDCSKFLRDDVTVSSTSNGVLVNTGGIKPSTVTTTAAILPTSEIVVKNNRTVNVDPLREMYVGRYNNSDTTNCGLYNKT